MVYNGLTPYSFNESNAYISTDGNILFFNSSENINNLGGLSDMNDIWFRNKNNGVWGSPVNLIEINTTDNDLILGLIKDNIIILKNGFIHYFDISNDFKLLKTEKVRWIFI